MKKQKPPLGASVNWSHPLANNLEALWLINEATGDKVFDVTRHGHDGTRNGMVQADWSVTQHGTSLDFNADTKWVSIPTAKQLAVTKELTIFALVRRNGDPGASWGRILHKANTSTGDDYAFVQRADDKTVQFRIRTSSTVAIVTAGPLNVGDLSTLVGTWNDTDGGMKLYFISQNESPEEISGTNTGTLNDAGDNLAFGRHLASSARNFNGDILVAGVSRRQWTRADAEWFGAEPYAMLAELEPQSRFAAVAAAVGQPYYIRDSYTMPDFLGNMQS